MICNGEKIAECEYLMVGRTALVRVLRIPFTMHSRNETDQYQCIHASPANTLSAPSHTGHLNRRPPGIAKLFICWMAMFAICRYVCMYGGGYTHTCWMAMFAICIHTHIGGGGAGWEGCPCSPSAGNANVLYILSYHTLIYTIMLHYCVILRYILQYSFLGHSQHVSTLAL